MSHKKIITIGLLGMGTVGTALVNLLQQNQAKIEQLTGYSVRIKRAMVRNLNAVRDCDVESIELVSTIESILADDIDIVIELIGGIEPASTYIQQALLQKKPVISANKSLIAEHGAKLIPAFKKQGIPLFYEAAVAGGVPIIRLLRKSLACENITQISAILNGTNNFILDQMLNHSMAFDQALEKAQQLGFAEADASFDIKGIDAAYKLSILSHLAFNTALDANINVEGIENITFGDLKTAIDCGYMIKHVAQVITKNGQLYLSVLPMLVPKTHALSNVGGSMNLVCLHSDAIGESMHYAPGAGGLPTAASVLSDINEVCEYLRNDSKLTQTMMPNNTVSSIPIVSIEPAEQTYCIFAYSEQKSIFEGFEKKLTDACLKAGQIDFSCQCESVRLVDQNQYCTVFKTSHINHKILANVLVQLSEYEVTYRYFPIF